MPAIASLSLNLTADLGGWSANLAKAGKQAQSFYSSASAGVGSVLKSIGPAAASAATGIAGVGIAVAAAGAAMVSAGLDRIDALSDASQRLGITTNSLSELRYAANLTGSSAEDLDGALEKLSANLGDSANKAGPTSEALARLGLDAAKLAQGGTDEAFKAIVGGFEKIPNASEKASLAMDIFGKGGVKILNTLGAGGGELERLAAEARKFGVSVSQVDAAKIGVAKDAMDRAGAALEGIGNTLAIQLAPLIEAAANQFTEWLGPAIDQAGGVEGAISGIVTVIGYVADAGWTAEKTLQEAFAGIISGAGSALEALGLGGETLRDTAANLRESIARDFDAPPSAKLGKFLDEVKVKAAAAATESAKVATANLGAATKSDGLAKSIAEVTTKLKEQADTFGKTAAEADVFKLAQQGATDAQLAGARAQADRLKGLEKAKKDDEELKGFAKEYWQNSLTAAQKYEVELGRIGAAKDAGLIDQATADRARAKAGKDAGLDEPAKFAGAAELGSAAAYSSVASALSGRGNGMAEVAKSSSSTAMNTSKLVGIFSTVAKFLGQPEPTLAI